MFAFNTVNFDLNQLLTTALQENESIIKAQDTYEIAQWTYNFDVAYYTGSNWDSKLAKQDMLAAEIALKQAQNLVVTTVNQAYASYKAYLTRRGLLPEQLNWQITWPLTKQLHNHLLDPSGIFVALSHGVNNKK